jgi:hypothetical protein
VRAPSDLAVSFSGGAPGLVDLRWQNGTPRACVSDAGTPSSHIPLAQHVLRTLSELIARGIFLDWRGCA